MSILARVLLPFLALLACQGAVGTARAHALRTNMLRESIRLLLQLQQREVSCNQMNVTNIFADNKGEAGRWFEAAAGVEAEEMEQTGDTTEVLCKAATVAWEGRSCHRPLEGVYDNLLGLLRGNRTEHKAPCPVAAGSTTSLKNFLRELQQVLQKEYKSQK